QSSRNWGWCRAMGRDVREIPLALESLRQWRGMNARIGGETGFRQAGIVYVAETEQELAAHAAWADTARAWQVDARVLRGEALAAVVPGAGRDFVGGLHTPGDGRAEPAQAAPAIAEAARRQGATILTECAVRGIETAGGRVAAAVTERGRIACDTVVLAGGAWCRLFCGNLGVGLPQLKVLATVMRTQPLEGGPEISASGGLFGFRKRMDGGYTVATLGVRTIDLVPDHFRLLPAYLPAIRLHWKKLRVRVGNRWREEWRVPRRWRLDETSPFEAVRVLDPEPDRFVVERARRATAEAFPVFRNAVITESWGGMIDVMPDAIPVISPVESLPGFFIATGFSGHGFGIGPGAGKLVADMVAGDPTLVDPAPFRLSRFTDGSNPRPHPLAS